MEIEERIKILEEVKSIFLNSFNNVISIYVYGSVLCKNFGNLSDFDFIIIFDKNFSIDEIDNVKSIKERYKNIGIKLDISIHTIDEMIGNRKKFFWHNNRGLIMQKEIIKYGKLLYGPNLFDDAAFSQDELMDECVTAINSIKYNAQKTMTLSLDDETLKKRLIKYSLSAILYALAFVDKLPLDKDEICSEFDKNFNFSVKVEDILKMKIKNYGEGYSLIEIKTKVFRLLTELDFFIFNEQRDR